MFHDIEALSLARQVNQVKVFGDGADLDDFQRLYQGGAVCGFTTNPTLMRRAGVADYAGFAQALLQLIPDRPVSFEVFSDEFDEMERQARRIAAWGDNVYVKIPITNTREESSLPLVRRLSRDGIKLNVTAILTLDQVAGAIDALDIETPAIISIFAGRIADTGLDPIPVVRAAVALTSLKPKAEVLWASTREVLNIYQAQACGCHIITAPSDIVKKLDMAGKDLNELTQETVAMFRRDAVAAAYTL